MNIQTNDIDLRQKKLANQELFLDIANWYRETNIFNEKDNSNNTIKIASFLNSLLHTFFDLFLGELSYNRFLNDHSYNRAMINRYNDFDCVPLSNYITSDEFALLKEIFNKYTFITEERECNDNEVNPEMIGSIFENLLDLNHNDSEDLLSKRRNTGSYYTPHEIVDYTIDEAINLLLQKNNIFTREKVVKKIAEIKIIDPAVGSGAFIIGCIKKLVSILQDKDPDNTKWRECQLSLVDTEEEKGQVRVLFDNNVPDYTRIFFLLQNNLYGVDIQEIALKIAKFRSFLSLLSTDTQLIGQSSLHLNFVCANTLFDYKDPIQSNNNTTGQQLDLFSLQEPINLRVLRDWNPYDINVCSDFFNSKLMFNVDSFDLVIGNPPYMNHKHMDKGEIERLQKRTKWKSDDLYQYFIFAGFKLTKKDGILSFIIPHSYIGFSTKRNVRDLFLDNSILKLTDLPQRVFGGYISTNVFFLLKRSPDRNQKYEIGHITYPDYPYTYTDTINYKSVNKMPNRSLIVRKYCQILDKVLEYDKMGSALQVLSIGVHSGNVRKKMFFKEKKEGEDRQLEKLIQGRQINQFTIHWDSPKAQYKYCDLNYECKPIRGVGKGGKVSRKNEYLSLKSLSLHGKQERLLIRQTADKLIVAYHQESRWGRLYTDETIYSAYSVTTDLKLEYFCGLLNSHLLNYIYDLFAQEMKKEMAQVKLNTFNELPFKKPTQEQHDRVVLLVNKMIDLRFEDPKIDIQRDLDQLDQIIYEIYEVREEDLF